jgi:CHAD domain-containing protein
VRPATTASEVKLAAPATFHLPPMEGVGEGTALQVQPEQHLRAAYYDTADLRLVRHGLTLRHRHDDRQAGSGEWTLVLAQGVAGAEVVPTELAWPGESGAIPPAAVALVRAYRRRASLGPVAHLVTRRRPLRLCARSGRPLVRIDDDLVSVMDGRRAARRFREIEVGVVGPAPGDLVEGVVERLVEAGATVSDGRSRLARALCLEAPAPDVAAVEVDAASTVAAVLSGAVARSYQRLLAHDVGVRLGHDEAVHQARVATRRLRSDLRTFRRVIDRAWYEDMQAELKWIADLLGSVRDLDVMTARIAAGAGDLAPADATAGEVLVDQLRAQRGDARTQLLAAMDGDRYGRLLDLLVAAAQPPFAHGRTGAGLGDNARRMAPGLVAGPWRRLVEAVTSLGADPSDDSLHQVRIRTKRFRYACGAVAGAVGEEVASMAKAAAALQDVLGELHDAVVAEQWLRTVAAGLPASAAAAARQVIAREAAAARRARSEWPPAWERLNDKSLRAWMR